MRRLIVAMLLFAAQVAAGQATDSEALALLLRDTARESAMHAAGTPVRLDVLPSSAPLLVTQVFAEELLARGGDVRSGDTDAERTLSVEIRDMHSSTAPSTKTSYFRKTQATVAVMLSDSREHRITWSREFELARTDTLDGTPPYERRDWLDDDTSWWDDVLAPALITVTAGIIVLLLFTVRGSS